MGKRKVKNEESLRKMVFPGETDVIGLASKVLGAERFPSKMSRRQGKTVPCTWKNEEARLGQGR